jgi:type III pantothenate kinase
MPDVLLLNVGNTHTRLVLWRRSAAVAGECVATRELLTGHCRLALLAAHPGVPCFAACVVPAVRQRFDAAWPGRVHWLTSEMPLGVDVSAVDAATIGADRLANAAAAVRLSKLPVLVIDFGTAVSSVVIDARRRLLGGFILPGRQLARTALRTGTGQLPDTALTDLLPEPVGRRTEEAILAGVDLGLLGAVERLVRDVSARFTTAMTTLAVGGDRDFFCRHLAVLTPGPEDFTLRGLAAVAEACRAGEQPGLPRLPSGPGTDPGNTA